MRAALLHVLGDALGSVGAIVAGICIQLWGWAAADGVAGLAIAALLVVSAARLMRDSVDILLERVPAGLDIERIAREIDAVEGVRGVHDLHIWQVTPGFPAMSAHVDITDDTDPERVRRAIHRLLHQDYGVAHTTIQTEAGPRLLEIHPPA